MAIAAHLGCEHPYEPGRKNVPITMSIAFLLTRRRGIEEVHEAKLVKCDAELDDTWDIDKLNIARFFAQRAGSHFIRTGTLQTASDPRA